VLLGKSASGTIVLSSFAPASVSIGIKVSGSGFSDLGTGTCKDTLGAGMTCTIEVGFTAGTTAGAVKGAVTVTSGGALKTVALSATVVTGEPSLIIKPTSASFQTTAGTASTPVTFNVSGDVSLSPLTVTITGPNKDDFAFKTTCPSIRVGGASESCQVTVVFSPKAASAGTSIATVTVAGTSISAAATAALTGTATKSLNPVDLIPVDNSVSGWTIDPSISGSKKPMIASTKDEGGALIDGGIEPYYADGFSPTQFLWQNYSNSHLPAAPADSLNPQDATLALYVFRMPSAEQASGLYQNLLKFRAYTRGSTTTSNGWEDPTSPAVGSKSRIQDTGADWWINFQKNEYYVEVRLSPSNGPAPDFSSGNLDLKKEALLFAQVVAEKL
jgi:hypothetical protein